MDDMDLFFRNQGMFLNLDSPDELDQGVSVRFKEIKELFINMTARNYINTQKDIFKIQISYDSTMAIVLLSSD